MTGEIAKIIWRNAWKLVQDKGWTKEDFAAKMVAKS
jgi:hypothetical protein